MPPSGTSAEPAVRRCERSGCDNELTLDRYGHRRKKYCSRRCTALATGHDNNAARIRVLQPPASASGLQIHVAQLVNDMGGMHRMAVKSNVSPATLDRIVSGRTHELIARTANKLAAADSTWSLEDYHRFVPAEEVRKSRSRLGFKAQHVAHGPQWKIVRSKKAGRSLKGKPKSKHMRSALAKARREWWASRTPTERSAIAKKSVRTRNVRRALKTLPKRTPMAVKSVEWRDPHEEQLALRNIRGSRGVSDADLKRAREAYRPGRRLAEIAAELHCSTRTARRWLRRAGVGPGGMTAVRGKARKGRTTISGQ